MNKHKRYICIFLLIIGGIGAIMFFPLKLKSGDTCMCEKIFFPSSSLWIESKSTKEMTQLLTRNYLFPYGVSWWASLAFLFYGITTYKKFENKKLSP